MSTLTTLAASASGLGVAIDFAIGKAGEKRARSWLETWWLKIADIRWNNFGRREAEFAVRLMDRWYGSHLLSIRRLVFVLLFITIAISIGHLLAIVHYATGWFSLAINQSLALYILISAIGLATSLSITRIIAIFVARICQPTMWKNFSVFTAFLIITYLIMVNWLPVWHAFQQTVIFHESNSFIDSKGIGFDDKKTQPLDPEHPSTPRRGRPRTL